MVPQEEMLSSVSLASDASAIHMTGNTISELALALFWSHPSSIYFFPDEILGPVVTSNQLSRNARITMSDNKLGRLRVIASPLAINFPVVGKVHGAVLSHNTVGPWIRTFNPNIVVLKLLSNLSQIVFESQVWCRSTYSWLQLRKYSKLRSIQDRLFIYERHSPIAHPVAYTAPADTSPLTRCQR